MHRQTHARAGTPLWVAPVCLVLALVATGCGQNAPKVALDDEPMKRALKEDRPIHQAAFDHFYPKHKPDYFEGMDVISVRMDADRAPNTPPSASAPVPENKQTLTAPQPDVPKKEDGPTAVADQKTAPDAKAGSNPMGGSDRQRVLTDPLLDKWLASRAVLPPQGGITDPTGSTRDFSKVLEEVKKSVGVDHGSLKDHEILGRNTWMMWSGGNEGFWDWLATDSLGFIDLLKLIDSRQRAERFKIGGLINEPQMGTASTPDEFGLWLDQPRDSRIREWREIYLQKSFGLLTEGKHKSQIGLKKKYGQYGATDRRDIYLGDVNAYKDKGYDYPSFYLPGPDDYSEGMYASSNGTYGDAPSEKEKADKYKQYTNYYDEKIPPPDIYGISSGVVGLRLFPNPNFDAEAKRKWDGKRYYEDKSYYSDPDLIRPYRVGVACAYCHASYHPLNPPKAISEPEWSNISGNIGSQYLRIRVAFGNLLTPDQYVYHLLDSQPPGTIDTSLIASDNINNPNTMNAVFNLPQRVILALRNPPEKISSESKVLPGLWKHLEVKKPANYATKNPGADGKPADGNGASAPYQDGAKSYDEVLEKYDTLTEEWAKIFQDHEVSSALEKSNDLVRATARVLILGDDSIGPWGALARVYLNIGSYWEQWNQVHQPVLGFTPQSPFRLRDCETHSVYWNATKLRVGGLRDYFLKVSPSMLLLSTPGGIDRLQPVDLVQLKERAKQEKLDLAQLTAHERSLRIDVSQLAHGRKVFANNCIVCHSSIQPESSAVTLYLPPEGNEDPDATKKRKDLISKYNERYADLIQRRKDNRANDARLKEFFEHDPQQWLRDPDYVKWAEEIVEQPAFWTWNYLSTDYRIPINLVGTNSGRGMGTNPLTGHMWEDFSSDDYRNMPSPGPISFFNPYLGKGGQDDTYSPRHRVAEGVPQGGGGIGFYRVPTLASVWATAPLLHNNSLGTFNNDPTVNGRLLAFDDAIRKLLWPAKRLESSSYNGATPERLAADHGLIWRTPQVSYLSLDGRRVPYFAKRLPFVSALYMKYPWLLTIRPLWLPSAVFFVGAMLILLYSNSRHSGAVGIGLIVVALLLWLIYTLADWYPNCQWLEWARAVNPDWLPVIVLLGSGLTLVLPFSPTWRRWIGYLYVTLGLLVGLIVYFNAGSLGDVKLGPIPKGTPVNLISNFNPEADQALQISSVKAIVAGLAEIDSRHLDPEAADKVLKEKVAPALMEVNKCPDFVMDKGHTFEWFKSMSDEDKNALIELLKTF